jgi:hypothetical protein
MSCEDLRAKSPMAIDPSVPATVRSYWLTTANLRASTTAQGELQLYKKHHQPRSMSLGMTVLFLLLQCVTPKACAHAGVTHQTHSCQRATTLLPTTARKGHSCSPALRLLGAASFDTAAPQTLTSPPPAAAAQRIAVCCQLRAAIACP